MKLTEELKEKIKAIQTKEEAEDFIEKFGIFWGTSVSATFLQYIPAYNKLINKNKKNKKY